MGSSVTAIDFFKGQGDTERPDASVDIGLSIRLSDGWLAYVRPWFFQSAQGSDWDKEIYQAALQCGVMSHRPGQADTQSRPRREAAAGDHGR